MKTIYVAVEVPEGCELDRNQEMTAVNLEGWRRMCPSWSIIDTPPPSPDGGEEPMAQGVEPEWAYAQDVADKCAEELQALIDNPCEDNAVCLTRMILSFSQQPPPSDSAQPEHVANVPLLIENQDRFLRVLSELYQVLGALDAPDYVLDQVSCAVNGDTLPHESLLPFIVPTLEERPATQTLQDVEVVPDGYVLVPIEPTPKMVDATWNDAIETNGGIESHNTRNKRIYKAMLTAAPPPHAVAQPVEPEVSKMIGGQINQDGEIATIATMAGSPATNTATRSTELQPVEGWSEHQECESCEAFHDLGSKYAAIETENLDLRQQRAEINIGVRAMGLEIGRLNKQLAEAQKQGAKGAAALATIEFVARSLISNPCSFLQCWQARLFETIRVQWPNAPAEIYWKEE